MIGEPVGTPVPETEPSYTIDGRTRNHGADAERTPRNPWSEPDRARLRSLCEQNLPPSAIASQLGRTQRAVDAMSLRLGIRRHEALKPWSDEECALVLRLHGEGASWAAIAEAVPGRSAIAVFRKLRHLVGPAPFKAACQPKPVVVAKAKRPTPPASVPAGVDAVVRWLRSRDFMVLRLESGWRVDHRVLATTEALLDFVNVRRGWLHLPPFALTATDCGEEPVAVPRLVTGKGPKRFGAMPIRFHPGRR